MPLKVLLSERKSERVSKLPVENLAMFPAALVFAEILLLQEEKPAMLMDEGPGFASFKFLHYQKKIKKKMLYLKKSNVSFVFHYILIRFYSYVVNYLPPTSEIPFKMFPVENMFCNRGFCVAARKVYAPMFPPISCPLAKNQSQFFLLIIKMKKKKLKNFLTQGNGVSIRIKILDRL